MFLWRFVAVVVVGCFFYAAGMGEQTTGDSETADRLFQEGQFAEAQAVYSRLVKADPKNFQAMVRLGYLALLENRFKEAEKWLTKAGRIKPEQRQVHLSLAELYQRQDAFRRAATHFRAGGQEVMAKKLESFAGRVPYQLPKKGFEIGVRFVQTDPLPLVEARVNGSQPVYFLIDTGGGELILSTDLAKQVGAVEFGGTTGLLAAGPTTLQNGRIDSLILGDLEIRNLPVKILERRFFAAGAPGKTVDGIIGTIVLYHFLATLDYVRGELVLRPRTKKVLTQFEKQTKKGGAIVVPFWMAGDHFILAWGRINDSRPMLWFVDTGLAGGGFIGSAATLKEAGIEVPAPSAVPAGAVVGQTSPFVVEKLSLGDAVEHRISGLQGQFSAFSGIRLDGIISHQFFRPYALTLDFEKMRLFLQKGTKLASLQEQSSLGQAVP